MNAELCLKDPVFQLNILLWMTKEQPEVGYRVRPLFHQAGYNFIYIEQPFPLPPPIAQAIAESGLDISTAPEPELILGNPDARKALYFEAKAKSFTPASTNCRQARAHLIAASEIFGQVIPADVQACLLCYVVADAASGRMAECLGALSGELAQRKFPVGPHSVQGLNLTDKSLVYAWDAAFKQHLGRDEDSVTIMDGVEEDSDPSPLLLVFSDEDCPNVELRDFYRRVVIDQVRAALLCALHAHPVGMVFETSTDQILHKTTDGLFQYLGRERQQKLRALLRENIFRRVYEFGQEKKLSIAWNGNALSFNCASQAEKDLLLDWLEDRRTKFSTDKPPAEPPSLFDGVAVSPE